MAVRYLFPSRRITPSLSPTCCCWINSRYDFHGRKESWAIGKHAFLSKGELASLSLSKLLRKIYAPHILESLRPFWILQPFCSHSRRRRRGEKPVAAQLISSRKCLLLPLNLPQRGTVTHFFLRQNI